MDSISYQVTRDITKASGQGAPCCSNVRFKILFEIEEKSTMRNTQLSALSSPGPFSECESEVSITDTDREMGSRRDSAEQSRALLGDQLCERKIHEPCPNQLETKGLNRPPPLSRVPGESTLSDRREEHRSA